MYYALNTPNFGMYNSVQDMVAIAREIEDAGWDGFFIWDHLGGSPEWGPIIDPTIVLAAIASATKRIKFGPIVTALPRTTPWKLAREVVTLDHLSQGRFVLGVGLGSDIGAEYSTFGQSVDDVLHGEMVDEALTMMKKLWTGEIVSYEGKHYSMKNARFLPTPLQQPHVPIWVAGTWPNKKPFRRAAQWDGVCPMGATGDLLKPEEFHEVLAYIKQHRSSDAPFEVLAAGHTQGTDEDKAIIAPYAEAGVTWWQESFDWSYSFDQLRERIRKGPPRF